jgi:hypothetical protein
LKWEMRGTGREGARGGRRGRRVEEVVCHGNFCKVRSLKMKKERERERERIFIQKRKNGKNGFVQSEERSSRSQKKIRVEWLLVGHVAA